MEKFSEKLKKFFSSEASLQRIPLYFFLTCVLLVVLIFKLGETNHYLKEIAENGTDVIEIQTKNDKYESVANVFIETEKNAEDFVPILDALTEENTEQQSNNISKENTTKTTQEETTTKGSSTTTTKQDLSNSNTKTDYVLNISSKKIHLADCSFVNRTKEENKKYVELTDEELQQYLDDGYTLCKTCGGE